MLVANALANFHKRWNGKKLIEANFVNPTFNGANSERVSTYMSLGILYNPPG